jgi:uncharacterized membrane protein
VQAIVIAEKNTSGEIRVHIEETSNKPPIERAKEVFSALEMHKTEAKNGVLFYVGVTNKGFAILGDAGINNVVDSNFWDTTKDVVLAHFKNREFKKGLVEGILSAGEKLKHHFPYQSDDTNELSNEISKG